jgi:glycosyltransferase involved in cell wall biosynthesis
MGGRVAASWLHRRFVRLEAAALKAARVVLTNSQRTSRDVIERLGVPAARVRCVYLGVDPRIFCPADEGERATFRRELGWPGDRPQAVFVGALGDSRKGLDLVLRSWRELSASESWDVDLNVVGAGRELVRWRRDAESSVELRGRVRFLGFRHDVPKLLKAADLLVAPARYEPYGLNVHEALCCGVPALTNRDAGVAEEYPVELNDLLIPDVEDVANLIDRLRGWRGRVEHYRSLVARLGQSLRRRTWDGMARDFVAAMGDVAVV